MEDPPRSPTPTPTPSPDFYNILGISKTASIKDICKAYKSLVKKWHPDKNPSNKSEAQTKFTAINEAYKVLSGSKTQEEISSSIDDSGFFSRSSFFPRSTSRRSQPTTPRTPSPLSSPLPKNTSLGTSTTPTDNSPTTLLKSASKNISTPATGQFPTSLSKNASRRSTTPIIFSQSTARRKPPPIEKKLECTLEELCNGGAKKIKITRDVINDFGITVQEEEILRIKIKPGWKKGTKITFEGKGDEKPGHLPADIIFMIDEKRHHLFKRDGDDLMIGVEIPLVQALTGCSLTVPLLGDKTMHLYIDDIIFPGYEKILRGQGMPKPKEQGMRGDLRINFMVNFPEELSDEQRSVVVGILQDSS